MVRQAIVLFMITLTVYLDVQTVNSGGSYTKNRKKKTGFCDIPNGSIYYEECGQGTPLILIHGIALIPVSPGLTGYEFRDPQILEYNEKLKKAETYEQVVEYILRQWCDGPSREPGQVDSMVRTGVRGAAHMVNLEKPGEFNAMVTAFLRGLK